MSESTPTPEFENESTLQEAHVRWLRTKEAAVVAMYLGIAGGTMLALASVSGVVTSLEVSRQGAALIDNSIHLHQAFQTGMTVTGITSLVGSFAMYGAAYLSRNSS